MVTVGQAQAEQHQIGAALEAGVTEPRVMSWHYAAPAVVLGRGQKPSPALLERAGRERLPVVGRLSGGGAVMAGPWLLSLTLLLPAAHALARMSLPAGYRAVGEACRRALDCLCVPSDLAHGPASPSARRTLADDELGWACFAGVSHGELVYTTSESAILHVGLSAPSGTPTGSGIKLRVGIEIAPVSTEDDLADDATIELLRGTTQIQSWAAIQGQQEYSVTNSISDYSDLRVKVHADSGLIDDQFRVYWVELAVPV